MLHFVHLHLKLQQYNPLSIQFQFSQISFEIKYDSSPHRQHCYPASVRVFFCSDPGEAHLGKAEAP